MYLQYFIIHISHQNEKWILAILWKVLQEFFLCVWYTVNRILKANIFTCSIQYLYNRYTLYFGINESLMTLWLPNLSLASQVSPAHNKPFCKGPNRNTSVFTNHDVSNIDSLWDVLIRSKNYSALVRDKSDQCWFGLLGLKPLSTIFQLYRGDDHWWNDIGNDNVNNLDTFYVIWLKFCMTD